MENRYQQFLKNTLKPGLLALQQNPLLTEVNGIPLATFNILVRAFRAGLSQELKIPFPHDLKNPEYLMALLNKVEILTSPGIPETTTLANAYTLPWLMENFENAQKVGSEQRNWQKAYEQQVAEFNRKIIAGVQTQLEEKLPSLPKEEIIKPLAVDIARTVKEALPYATSPEQAEELVQRVTQVALKTYASTAKEIQENSELPAQIAQALAQENAQGFQELIENKTKAPVSSLYNTQLAVEEAIVANLPAAARDPKAIRTISTEVIGRIHAAAGLSEEDYRLYLTQTVQAVLAQEKTQQLLQEGGAFLPLEKQTEIASNISQEVTPEAYKLASSPEFAQTPLAGGLPAAPTMAAPPIVPPAAVRGIPQMRPEAANVKDLLAEGWVASHPTDFIFFGLSAPSLKTIPTAIVGLAMDIVGIVPPAHQAMLMGYLGMDEQKLGGYINYYSNMAQSQKGREALGYQSMASFLSGIQVFKHNAPPVLQPLITLGGFYGRFQQFNFQFAQKTGIGLSQFLNLVTKYGGPGATFGVEMAIKVTASRIVGASLHAALPKLFPYDELAMEVYFKYGPKGIAKATKNFLYEKVGKPLKEKLAQTAAGKALISLAAKLGLTVTSLASGVGIALSILTFLAKPLWDLAKLLLAFLTGLIIQYGTPALLGAIGGGLAGLLGGGVLGFKIGLAIGTAIGGPLGAVVGAIVGTVLGAFVGFFGGAFAGAGLGILLSSIAGQAAGFVSGILSGLGSLPSLGTYAAPIGATSLLAVGIPTGIYFFVVSDSFVQQGQPSPVQSEYITVAKAADFSGKLGDPINFTVIITAPKSKLNNLKAVDTTTSTCQGTPPEIPVRDLTVKLPKEILPGTPITLNYQLPTTPDFNDCLITNVIQVTADIPDEQRGGETSFTMANVSIGNPPVVAPVGPPLKGNVCLSGYDFGEREPDGTIHNGVDLVSDQPSLFSTFLQPSKVVNVCKTVACLCPTCGGYSITLAIGRFTTYVGHLASPPPFNVGDTVPGGALDGLMGNTGRSTAPHVHYVVYQDGKPVNPHGFGVNPPKCH